MQPCGTYNVKYEQDMAIIRTRFQWGLFIAFLVLLFALPSFLSLYWVSVLNIIGITIIAVHGLNILTGYCGQISMGQAAFMGVGGYTSAILATKLGWPFWACLPTAAIVSGLVGLVFGASAARVKGFYLAVTTLAAQFIIIYIIEHWELTGGIYGLAVPPPELGGIVFNTDRSFAYIILVMVVLTTFLAKNIARTRMGRAFTAIKDNDLAAEVMGINLFAYKMAAFFICCAFAGIAGSLLASYTGHIVSEQFSLMDSIWYLGMIIVGGMGTTMGPIFGVVFLKLLQFVADMIGPQIGQAFPEMGGAITGSLTLAAFAIVIALFLVFEPRGLSHRWEMFKASYRLHPYSY